MKFFSKLVFICNLCFVAAVILRWVEMAKQKTEGFNGQLVAKPLQSTLVVLGYGAIFINLIFLLAYFFVIIAKRGKQIPKWLVISNIIFFLLQVYYFFFSNL
jgi:hypothetical protein